MGSYEADAVASARSGIAQGLCHEGLTHAYRADKEHMLMAIKEVQGEDGVYEVAVHICLSRPVEVLQPAISSNPAFCRCISRLRSSRRVT